MAISEAGSVFDTSLDQTEEARLDAIAEAEIEARRGAPHNKVRDWLVKSAKGERRLPPAA
jgi:hypothetical protein